MLPAQRPDRQRGDRSRAEGDAEEHRRQELPGQQQTAEAAQWERDVRRHRGHDGGGHGQSCWRKRRRTIGAEHRREHPAGVIGHDHGDDEAGRERQRAGAEHLEREHGPLAEDREAQEGERPRQGQPEEDQPDHLERRWELDEHVRLGGIEVGADVGEHSEDDQEHRATRPT